MLPSHRSKEPLDPVFAAMVNIEALIAVSESEISAAFWILFFVTGMVLLMKKTVQPLLNGNVHGRRRHLRIYFIKGNVMDVVEVRKVE